MISIASLVHPDNPFHHAHHDPYMFMKQPAPPLLPFPRVKPAMARSKMLTTTTAKLPPRVAAPVLHSNSELGEAPNATNYNARTGRPVRKVTAPLDSPFVDSAVALSDDESSADETVAHGRKRKRSPSPAFSEDDNDDFSHIPEDLPEDEAMTGEDFQAVHTRASPAAPTPPQLSITIKDLTINVAAGHTGPVLLQLDPSTMTLSRPQQEAPVQPSKRRRVESHVASPQQPSASRPKRAGFLDLPAELRNEIYRQVFTQKQRLDFSAPANFCRGAALLRTCRQVHEEGRSILYGENEFLFGRRTCRYGSFWESEWRELGFRAIRKFVKSIGPYNLSLIRHVGFQFEDATPCLNPNTMTHDERRFVNDDVLISVLRTLGDFSQLQKFEMNFHGRRRVERSDQRFLDYLKRIKADEVNFFNYPIGLQTAYATESKQEDAVTKMLLKTMVRKHKLYPTKQ